MGFLVDSVRGSQSHGLCFDLLLFSCLMKRPVRLIRKLNLKYLKILKIWALLLFVLRIVNQRLKMQIS